MAVTVTASRVHTKMTTFYETANLALSGTYVTGGFAFNPLTAVKGGLGSSPFPSGSVAFVIFNSPLGYIYQYVPAGNLVKIFTAANTELANGAAVPEAAISALIFLLQRG